MKNPGPACAAGRQTAVGGDGQGRPGHSGGAWRRLWSWLVLAWVLPWLAACGELPRPPLAVGVNAWVGYDPLVLARERGLADARRVKMIELSSHAESFRHFRNGLLDAMAVTLDQALELADQGVPLRIVAVLDESAGADVVMAHRSVRRAADLKGQRVALEDSALNRLLLQRLLAPAGLTEGDVSVVILEASQHLAALQSGRVVAAVSYEPLASQMREAGFVSLFDTRQMPGEIVDVLVVRPSALAERPDDVDALLRAWNAGLASYKADPDSAAAVLAPGTGLSVGQYQLAQAGLHYFTPQESLDQLLGQPALLQLGGQRLADSLLAMQLLRQPVDWAGLIDAAAGTRVLPAVAP